MTISPQQFSDLWRRRAQLVRARDRSEAWAAIDECLAGLSAGELRIAEAGEDGEWRVNEWLKKAILLHFLLTPAAPIQGVPASWYDKVPLRFTDPEEARAAEVRLVPGALVRHGAYIGPNTVLMPSFVNIGAYIGENSMIDTWATVGSCAQIGRNVHISGGAGIGGVLEPMQALPTIIEDDCFIGARAEIVEGVIVERGAVIAMGVHLGQSTRIYDRATGEVSFGRVPAGAVVVPGALPASDGSHSLACAVIVKRVDAATRARTALNELLRSA